jgi:hypothetical protein
MILINQYSSKVKLLNRGFCLETLSEKKFPLWNSMAVSILTCFSITTITMTKPYLCIIWFRIYRVLHNTEFAIKEILLFIGNCFIWYSHTIIIIITYYYYLSPPLLLFVRLIEAICINCNKRFKSMRSVSMHLKITGTRHLVNFINYGGYDKKTGLREKNRRELWCCHIWAARRELVVSCSTHSP